MTKNKRPRRGLSASPWVIISIGALLTLLYYVGGLAFLIDGQGAW